MKMILAIVQDSDAVQMSNKFMDNDIRATKLSTTGGFLKAGNVTFIIGIEDERVDEVLAIIKSVSKIRRQYLPNPSVLNMPGEIAAPIEVEVKGATVFVLDVDGFYHL